MIYFHHFHKAAGTSIVNYLAKEYDLPKAHVNGNPVDKNGFCIEFWNFHPDCLKSYMESEMAEGVELFVSEWGITNSSIIRLLGGKAVTVLREPVERLWSNYCFDVLNKYFFGGFDHYVRNPAIPYQRGDYYSYELMTSMARQSLTCSGPKDIASFAEFLVESFDEILYLKRGELVKVKDANIIDVSELRKENSSSWYRSLRTLRPKPRMSDHDKEVALSCCKLDIELVHHLKSITL